MSPVMGPSSQSAAQSGALVGRRRSRAVELLIFCGVFLAIAVVISTALVISNLRHRALVDSERELQNIALVLAEQSDRAFQALGLLQTSLIDRMQTLGIVTTEDYERQMSGHDVHLMLKDKISGLPHVDAVTMISAEGKLINSSRYWPIPNVNVADRDYFKALKSDDSLTSFLSEPVRNRGTGTWTIYLARKFAGPNGEFLGLVLAAMELQYFERFFSTISLGPDANISLFRSNGLRLARYPQRDDPGTHSYAEGALFKKVLAHGDHGVTRLTSLVDGKERLLAGRRLTHFPVVVAVGTTVVAALADWRSGTRYFVLAATLIILVIGGIIFVGVRQIKGYELLARTRAEKAAREFLSTVVENVPATIFVKDARERRYVLINRAGEQYFGIPRDRMIGKTSYEVFPKAAADLIATYDKQLIESGAELFRDEHPMETPANGKRVITTKRVPILDDNGAPEYLLGVIQDITERKRLEETERQAKETLAAVIDASPVAIICLAPDRTVVTWSRAAEQMFGYSAQETIGQPYKLVPPGEEEELDKLFRRALAGETLRDIHVHRQRKDGTIADICFSGAAMYDRDGSVRGVAYALEDITERIAKEEQFRQAQKMEAVGQLTGGIAHDFNNMLTVIVGTAEILSELVADKPELAALAKMIDDAAERGADLTKRLLAFARKQPLQPQETDINDLVFESAKLLQPTLGENIEIETRLAEDAWPALIDPSQLSSALVNLAVNARDAMPNGGKLTLETGNVVLDEDYAQAHNDVEAGPYVMLAISDTGTGMPVEVRDKVFEPFFTTKEVGKGTGLGLSMVYGFVKQSGGHIKIYSEEGHGTAIRLYLPRAGADANQQGETSPEAALRGGTEIILLVEDDELVRRQATVQLESLGYVTLPAANAAEALALLDQGGTPDLLLTDVIMPGGMNGRQLAEEVIKRRPSIKVLYTSGYSESALAHQGRLDPGVLLLVKPYRKADLARLLHRALGKNSDTDEPTHGPLARDFRPVKTVG
jgi:PAS domain S-box-containing protein